MKKIVWLPGDIQCAFQTLKELFPGRYWSHGRGRLKGKIFVYAVQIVDRVLILLSICPFARQARWVFYNLSSGYFPIKLNRESSGFILILYSAQRDESVSILRLWEGQGAYTGLF